MGTHVTRVAPHPFYLLFQVGVKIQHLGQMLEREVELSLTQWAILKILVDHPMCSAQILAERVGIQPGTLTPALKRLERKKFIHLGKDPADQRKKALTVTRQGKQALDGADTWLALRIKSQDFSLEAVQELWTQLQRIA